MSEFEKAKRKLVGINKAVQGPRPTEGKYYGVPEFKKNDDLQYLLNEVKSLQVDNRLLTDQNAKLLAALSDSYCFSCDGNIGNLKNVGCDGCKEYKALLSKGAANV